MCRGGLERSLHIFILQLAQWPSFFNLLQFLKIQKNKTETVQMQVKLLQTAPYL